MGLRMKNFHILGIHWKIQLLGGWSSWKTGIEGGLPKKGAWTVYRFKGGLARGGGCFWGGVDTLMLIIIWSTVLEIRAKHTETGNCRSFFALLPPSPKNPKNQNFEKWKNLLNISSFYTCTKNHNHMMYDSELQSETGRIFCHFGPFFALSATWKPGKSKF